MYLQHSYVKHHKTKFLNLRISGSLSQEFNNPHKRLMHSATEIVSSSLSYL